MKRKASVTIKLGSPVRMTMKPLRAPTEIHITNVKSRVTSYENLWKVIEEPKPKKKKKFKRRV